MDITGKTLGKGFQGGVKGIILKHKTPLTVIPFLTGLLVLQCQDPGRVLKGKKCQVIR